MAKKNTKPFQNYVRHYEKIRNILRHMFMYGDYSNKDFTKNGLAKSNRSVYYSINRIQNYLGNEYFKTHELPNRKKDKKGYRLMYDPFICPINYLADTYVNCSYVIEDFIFYFTLMQAFIYEEEYYESEIYEYDDFKNYTDDICELIISPEGEDKGFEFGSICDCFCNIYTLNKKFLYEQGQAKFSDYKTESELTENSFKSSKIKDRLDELSGLGILTHRRRKTKYSVNMKDVYSLAPDIFKCLEFKELEDLQRMVLFFYNFSFLSAAGYHLSQTLNLYVKSEFPAYCKETGSFFAINENPVFFYKNNRLQTVIDNNVFWQILYAIHKMKPISFIYNRKHTEGGEEKKVYPVKIITDLQYDRQYLYAYDYQAEKFNPYRIDSVSNVDILEINEPFVFINNTTEEADIRKEIEEIYKKNSANTWNVSFAGEPHRVLLHFTFPQKECDKLYNRLISTGRFGNIKKTSDCTFDYDIEVKDENAMVPWIRSWGSMVMVDKATNSNLFDRIYNDSMEALKQYE